MDRLYISIVSEQETDYVYEIFGLLFSARIQNAFLFPNESSALMLVKYLINDVLFIIFARFQWQPINWCLYSVGVNGKQLTMISILFRVSSILT